MSNSVTLVRANLASQNTSMPDFVTADAFGASHAFFDWKPDQRTKDTFAKYGVPYAAKMQQFFDEVFY